MAESEPAQPVSRPESPLVLVVDDDESIREVAGAALELVGGYRVITAHSGSEAVSTAAAEHPDVILLDVMMPGTDGPTTCQVLTDQPATATIPIIFLTAKSDHLPPCRTDNVRGLILKPFDPMQLSQQVDQLVGWTT